MPDTTTTTAKLVLDLNQPEMEAEAFQAKVDAIAGKWTKIKKKAIEESIDTQIKIDKISKRWMRRKISFESQAIKMRNTINRIGAKWVKTKQEIRRSMTGVLASISAAIGLMKTVLQATGTTLDPAQEAILTLIASSVSSLMAISAAFTSTGVGVTAGAMFASIAIGLNIVATANTIMGISESKKEMEKATTIMGNLQSLSTSFSWAG